MATGVTEAFGPLLRRFRLAAGLSQEALAGRANLSATAIAALERGRNMAPRAATVALLADALGLEPADRAVLVDAATTRRAPVSAHVDTVHVDTVSSPPSASLAAPPIPPTRLIGRDRETTAVVRLLQQADVRLLTLTGPGGVGKTRLALAALAALRDAHPDGVAFVDLAPLRDPALVAPTIARALGLHAVVGVQEPRALLATWLRERTLLLTLDNFEQVAAAAVLLAELIVECPRLTALVTSRTALRVRAEQQFRVPPLALPDPAWDASPDHVADSPAVQLFVARAQAVRPHFALRTTDAAAVAEICQRLDGLPLAIELAAARVALAPPTALLDRIKRRLASFDGARDLPARQRTLRATIDWSYDLLDPGERQLFARLSVFVSGATLEAVEVVCGQRGAPDVLDGLASLVDKSLLQRVDAGGESRVQMLETLREYAGDRLAASGEDDILRHVHAAYYVALAEAAEQALLGPEQALWLERLEREIDNLRSALAWTRARAAGPIATDSDLGLRLMGASWRFWHAHGRLSEGRRWLEDLLALQGLPRDDAATAIRAKALHGAGWLTCEQGDYTQGVMLYEESLALWQRLDDKRGIAAALRELGIVANVRGDARALPLLEESLALSRELGDASGIAAVLSYLGVAAFTQSRLEQAAALFEESLALGRERGDTRAVAYGLFMLGNVAHGQGEDTRATALLEESLTLSRETEDTPTSAYALTLLAYMARARGDLDRATAWYAESLAFSQSMGSKWLTSSILNGFAGIALARGQAPRAARLFGAATALREAIGYRMSTSEQAGYEREVAAVREAMGDLFEAAWAAGEALSLERAIAEALAEPPAR